MTKTKKLVKSLIASAVLFMLNAAGFFILRGLDAFSSYVVWIQRTFFSINVFIFSFLVYSVIAFLIRRWVVTKKKYEKTPEIFNKLVAVFIYSVSILMILAHYNVSITPLVASLGIAGLAIGLALQGTLSNLFAGLQIISDKNVDVGDFVEFEDNRGYIDDVGWRNTRIKTLTNNYLIVPNSRLADSYVMNNSKPSNTTGILIPVGVDYSSDLDKVEKVTLDVAKKIQKSVDGTVKDYEPKIRFREFGESNINLRVILEVEKPINQFFVTSEFIKALKKRYKKEGIEISWPVRKVYQYKK